MSSLVGRFQRDVLYLEQGEVPREISGQEVKALKYDAEAEKTMREKEEKRKQKEKPKTEETEEEAKEESDHNQIKRKDANETELESVAPAREFLNDADIARLSRALIVNQKFCGPLELQNNGLTDFACLQLAKVFEPDTGYNVT